MSSLIEVSQMSFVVGNRDPILDHISVKIPAGQFVVILGENGAGKTSLLDILMGFRGPTNGNATVYGKEPYLDPWQDRSKIVYLSEKAEIPGNWTAKDFLEFNAFFYKNYSKDLEEQLQKEFRLQMNQPSALMSAGEVRRVQIVGALAAQPELILVDEVTAVLDILIRRRLMHYLKSLNEKSGTTILLATNILENLESYATSVMLLDHGKLKTYAGLSEFLGGRPKTDFAEVVANRLESQ